MVKKAKEGQEPTLPQEGLEETPQEEPQEGRPEGQEPEGEEPETGEAELDPQVLLAELRRARREAAKYRAKLREFEQREEERRRAEMSEVERLKEDYAAVQARALELETQLQELRIRQAVVTEAARLGFADPEDAWHLVDLSIIDVDEEGRITGVREALRKLAAQKPYLLRGRGMPGAGEPGRQRPSPEELRRQLFGGGGASIWEGGGYIISGKTEVGGE